MYDVCKKSNHVASQWKKSPPVPSGFPTLIRDNRCPANVDNHQSQLPPIANHGPIYTDRTNRTPEIEANPNDRNFLSEPFGACIWSPKVAALRRLESLHDTIPSPSAYCRSSSCDHTFVRLVTAAHQPESALAYNPLENGTICAARVTARENLSTRDEQQTKQTQTICGTKEER